MDELTKLIYGKGEIERIVCLEPGDENCEIFYLDDQKQLKNMFVSSKYWILASKPLWENSFQLSGNLHYKYGMSYGERDSYIKAKGQLRNKDIYTIFNAKENHMVRYGNTYFKGLKTADVSVLAMDIETTGLDPRADDAKLLMIASTYRDRFGTITRKLFSFDEFDSTKNMINAWCEWVKEVDPDIIAAHNGHQFDWNYLMVMAETYGTSLNIGRDGSSIKTDNWKSKFRKDQLQFIEYYKPACYGRELVDTLFLASKFDTIFKKYESLNLKKIIEAEGIVQKDRVFYDANRIRFDYKDPKKLEEIKKYCIFDGDDCLSLYDLYIPSYFYTAQSVPKSLQEITQGATGSQINSIMVRSYLQDKHSIPKADEIEDYEGAISFGKTGIYSNINKIDVASLYPNCIRQYEIYEPKKDPNKNFLKMVEFFTVERLKNKKLGKETGERHYKDLEQCAKVFINSSYGFAGASGLNFNSLMVASEITRRGREVLTQVQQWAESKNYVIANGDTDSISYGKSDGGFFTEEERKQELIEVNSLFPEKIKFEADGFFKKFIVLKAKNYIMVTEDGKLKKKGSSLKDSKTSKALKEFTDRVIQAIVDDKVSSVLDIYNEYVKEIMDVKDITRWASKRNISQKVMSSERSNETKIREAIEDTDVVEGDKVWMIYLEDDSLCMVDQYEGNYHKDRLLENLYKKTELFCEVIDTSNLLNYKLKRNKEVLYQLIGKVYTKPEKKTKNKKDSIQLDLLGG